jgi:hypothetical protein
MHLLSRNMSGSQRPNRPVNADARVSAELCWRLAARAGYWER